MPKQVLRELSQAKLDIQDADLLLFRGKGIVSRMIRSLGRGLYTHAAKASWIKGELFCLEVRELKGGRAVTLRSQVMAFPSKIDVFRVNAIETNLYDRAKADNLMLLFAGVEYGYLDLLETFTLHAWGIRLLATANVDDEFVSSRPPYCSAACAIADRVGGGVDPVPNLADNITEPSDLARSPFYRYLCTLVPDVPPEMLTGPSPEMNDAAKVMAEAKTSEPPPVPVTDIAGGSVVVKPVEMPVTPANKGE